MLDTQDDARMATAMEELAAAVRLLRTHLATDREEGRGGRAAGRVPPSRWLIGYILPLALATGVALGLAVGLAARSRAGDAAATRPREFTLRPALPADAGAILSEGLEGDSYRITYATRDGKERRTLFYWVRGTGQPFGKVILPAAPEAER